MLLSVKRSVVLPDDPAFFFLLEPSALASPLRQCSELIQMNNTAAFIGAGLLLAEQALAIGSSLTASIHQAQHSTKPH